ncbi:IgA Peptidase M64 [Lentibacillus halodurans]|uniref:IgA Peptidase M64 n=1 Tax=Lentibacillus halodurans TaxID=237679 RepID=A0A1I0YNR6_9BACI|nr:M64 family metallopeptidase [Lentibacillus halodurans]SFB14567.1 IgA Peptidase M64 [Lentibacillus halodurans]
MIKRRIGMISMFLVLTLLLSNLGFIGNNLGIQETSTVSGEELEVGDVNIVPLQETGPADERLNLVIFGDGYTADEMDKFHEDVDRNQNVQWSVEPFRSYRNYFNVYMVETPSKDSGISCDPDDGNVRRDTVFNLQYVWSGDCPADELARGIYYGDGGAEKRNEIIREHLAPELGISPDAQNIQTLAIANTFTYGGIGGVHATTSGGSPQGPLISLHELGHSLGNLQDEYPYNDRDVPGGPHDDDEPNSIHHTRLSSDEMMEQQAKWWRWLGEESESGGIIRAADPDGYESGAYTSSNVWRPSEHSMMRWIGFYFDQVGREHMTQRITGMRDAGEMPLQSTPEGEVGSDEIIWVQTMHPRFHLLDVTWEVNGTKLDDTNNSRYLDLANLELENGDTVKVTVKDQTEFVRNPDFLDGSRMTQTREWVIGSSQENTFNEVKFTNHSPTGYALANDEVAFVETTNPNDRILDVTWNLNGEEISDSNHTRHLDLSEFDLPSGASELTAIVTDPSDPEGESDTITWTVDNGLPTAPKTLSDPLTTVSGNDEHHIYFNEFDMLLEPEDDQPGFVVGEFRLNKDGWFNYFGFPDEPEGTPFKFSHSGTEKKALVYGNLGTGGLSKAAFEQEYTEDDPGGPFIPGFGSHIIEHRAIDAAGNIGEAEDFQVTVLPGESPECTEVISDDHNGPLIISEGVTCLEDTVVNGGVTVQDGASLVAFDSSINGGLNADNANVLQMFGTAVSGASTIHGTASDTTLAGNEFNGSLTLSNNHQISHNEQYGEYGPILAGNTLNGSLVCNGNNTEINDFGASNDINGPAIGQCAELGVSAPSIQNLVEELEEEGAFSNGESIQALQRHLMAVAHYENQEEAEKVVQHMDGFQYLLDHQLENGIITNEAYESLSIQVDALKEVWS